jgi:hypothetical protein
MPHTLQWVEHAHKQPDHILEATALKGACLQLAQGPALFITIKKNLIQFQIIGSEYKMS